MPRPSHQASKRRGAQVGPARVVVVDLGGEKLQDAPGGLRGRVNRDAGRSGAAGERMSSVPAVIPCPSKLVSLIFGALSHSNGRRKRFTP